MTPPGAYIFGCAGLRLSSEEAAFFARANPWGFILFARNVQDKAQLSSLTAELREAVGWNAPILIDQEGGRVQRMRGPIWREFPPALEEAQALSPEAAERAFWVRGRALALDLHDVGIDVNCAPLADVACDETHPVLRNRCYGTGPDDVILNARALADGLLAGGVLPVLKHLPGYGRGTVDSHKDLPRVSAPLADLWEVDFAPFQALSDMALGMTAHLVYDAIDPDRPATVSPVMMELIRTQIGFDGLIMTDDISMEALSGTVAERSLAAIRAGCDLSLHCNGDLAQMEQIAAALGPMSDRAVERAEAALAQRNAPQPVDIPALEAERTASSQ